MIPPLKREVTLDLSQEPLGPGWLRRAPTMPEAREDVGHGVWRTGPSLSFRQELVAGIDSAREIILLCSFLLADDTLAAALLRAAKRGVRVYVLTASEQRIGKVVQSEEGFEQRMADQHKQLLESLTGNVLLRSAGHVHAKFLVVDPQSSTAARAWLSTANLNKALQDNVELGACLGAREAGGLGACFHWAFWCEAERELRADRRLGEVRPKHPGTPLRPGADSVLATLSDETRLRARVLAMIAGAQHEILVASYGFSFEHAAVQSIVDAATRGVKVTVMTRPRPAVAAAVAGLARAGATIVAHDKLHAKALVVDGSVLVMSANLEAHGLDSGFEVGVVLSGQQAAAVERSLREWADSFPWTYRAAAKRGEHTGEFCPAREGLRDGVVTLVPSHTQRMPPVIAASAVDLGSAPTPALKPDAVAKALPQRVTFTWDVVPPTLPKGAKERMQEVERDETSKDGKTTKTRARVPFSPQVFDHAGKAYVVIAGSAPDDVTRAQDLATRLGAAVVVK